MPLKEVLVTSRASVGKLLSSEMEERDNIAAVEQHMVVSREPLLYAIALPKDSFSYELVSKAQAFVVNFVPEHLKGAVSFCSSASGKHVNKFRKLKLAMEEAEKVDCLRLKDASAFLECKVSHRVDCGKYELFIGKVLHKKAFDREVEVMFG